MKTLAVIPARYSSSRFEGKPLKLLAGKALIRCVYERVKSFNLFDEIIIATDDDRIFNCAVAFGAKVELTSANLKSGTDRVAQVSKRYPEYDVIFNIQGDEPFIDKISLEKLLNAFSDPKVEVASLMAEINEMSSFQSKDVVKVVCDKNDFSLYFSRAKIPFNREEEVLINSYLHLGVYAYRKNMLEVFVNLPYSKLENIEKLEQLRLLENAYKIKMIKTDYDGFSINTKEDLIKAEERIISNKK